MVKFLLSQCRDGVLRFKYISNEDVRALKEVLETLTYERALFLTARRILTRSQKILRFSLNVCFKLFVAWTPRHNEQVETQVGILVKLGSDFACALSTTQMITRALRRRNLLLRILTTRSRVNIFPNSTHNRFTKHTNHDSYSKSNAKATTAVISLAWIV